VPTPPVPRPDNGGVKHPVSRLSRWIRSWRLQPAPPRHVVAPPGTGPRPDSYVIISGTGRAGTTLLVQVLSRVGLDTGFAPEHPIDPVAHAGLERRLRTRPPHRIVKAPGIANEIEACLAAGIRIEHAIICCRDLFAAAESRRRVQGKRRGEVPGGLVMTEEGSEQEAYLAIGFFKLIYHLSAAEVPMTFLHYPRYALDVDYAEEKLAPIFPEVPREKWREALRAAVRTDLMHDWEKKRA